MKKISVAFLIFGILSLFLAIPARADGDGPVLVNGTKPISTDLRAYLNDWLASDAPFDAPYYAVTYTQNSGSSTLVSLVALNISSPDDNWTLEDGHAVWLGTVRVMNDGEVRPFSRNTQTGSRSMGVLAMPARLPAPSAGGGSYVAFPWQAGKAVMYGPRGVHGDGDYGTSGMLAVDLVSGSDLGSGAADDYAYASDAGVVDYVCSDGTTVTVRTFNEDTGDYFIYAHLLSNASLALDTNFTRGQSIGSIKHGTFKYPPEDYPGNCGWAQQQDTHWHLHWMFVPADDHFRAEDCILTISSQAWECGTETVRTGQWLMGGGGSGHGPDGTTGYTGSGSTADGSLWDYLIVGIAFIIDPFFKLIPEHQGLQFVYTIYYTAELVIKLVLVFALGNINLFPTLVIFSTLVGFQAISFQLWLLSFTFKAWKSLVPIFGA